MNLVRAPGFSLSRRLIEYYLVFGLACVFGTISLAIVLAWRGTFLQYLALTVAVPICVLLAGAFTLRRTVLLHQQIEEQLIQIGSSSLGLHTILKPLPDAAPLAIGWNTMLQQIESNRTLSLLENRLQDTLSASQNHRWATIFQTLSDGIAITDKQRRVADCNNAFLALTGLNNKEQAIGSTVCELLAAVLPEASLAPVRQQLELAGPLTLELRKGSELAAGVWRLCRSPLNHEPFESGSCLWTIRDVTQQKLADEMRNQFVFTATHELRTPLANIKAYAETLAVNSDIDVEKQKGFYNIINMEATRLARFVDELLNVSQIEAGAITIARHETDLERLLQEVIEHAQPQIRQKSQQFESRLPAKLPKLRVDKDKIAAAIVNLLGNAVKYTPEGGRVRLVVETDGGMIHFHVEDTGFGIAADELPRICQKFFRSQDARVRAESGSGLGLAFTQEVARLHGGKVSAASELNKGSRFTLTLPLS